ncbi:Flp family type IVb pilin [Rhizobium grahamii]|uniref:Pilus assembly protein n=1 Tax=Rhizobium grahamii TaxID=1120045 RepID=A0A370KLM9_9HYPH|nr:Flp family type IVb pilin [Rhizobium grahamii]RDJ09444.1 pilus assembly protein [Rhizobium grahamii]
MQRVRAFLTDIRGATAIEYGLIASLVAMAIIVGFGALSGNLANLLVNVGNYLKLPN